jgi:hypothetical protein
MPSIRPVGCQRSSGARHGRVVGLPVEERIGVLTIRFDAAARDPTRAAVEVERAVVVAALGPRHAEPGAHAPDARVDRGASEIHDARQQGCGIEIVAIAGALSSAGTSWLSRFTSIV